MDPKHLANTITTSAFALAALLFAAAFSPAQAHAYSINLDCTPGGLTNPTWAGTTNTITVKAVKKNGTKKTLISRAITQDDCYTFANLIQGFDTTDVISNVVRFEISTNGSNAFWLDRAWSQEGSSFLRWDVEDHVGFCFSTVASDGNNANCRNASAFVQWNLTTGN